MYFAFLLSFVAAEMVAFGANSTEVSMLELSSDMEGQFDMFKTQQRGEGTYYGKNGDNQGACEDHKVSGNRVLWGHNAITVAINKPQWYNGRACGTCLEVTSPRMGLNQAFAIVNNLCPECHKGDLDFATNGDGRWNDLRWKAVPCAGSFFSKFAFIMQGSNEWYLKVAVKRSKFPVTKLEVKSNGRWISHKETQGSYFIFTGQQLRFPLPVRVTSVDGQKVEDVIKRMANEQLIEGSKQFSGGGGGGDDDEDAGGNDDSELWPKLYSLHKCALPSGESITNVQSRSDCEKQAKDQGRRYYSFLTHEGSIRCYTSETCDGARKTSWNWNVYEQPGEAATPKPTPEATPKPTPEATPPPTPEAEGVCQPWCHKHEITKWGSRGTDTPGAKCSWKRCGGCAQCAIAAASFVESAPASPEKKTFQKARRARRQGVRRWTLTAH